MRLDPHRPPLPDSSPVRLDRAYEVDELPTPALVLDLEAVERNITRMATHAETCRIGLRPHTKTHKCPMLAHRQMAAGALGVCCAKISEAEVMLHAGIEHVLVTSPVFGYDKVTRVVEAARVSSGRLAIVVDCIEGARQLDEVASSAGVVVTVLIDCDPGLHRTGVPLGDACVALAEEIDRYRALELMGLQCYAGHLMHLDNWQERSEKSTAILQEVHETRQRIEKGGISLPTLTGGGTGTFDIDCRDHDFTDLQVGSYLLMDAEYGAIPDRDGYPLNQVFETGLFVLTTAISQSVPHLITIDAGFKAISPDSVPPELLAVENSGTAGRESVKYHFAGDEHGMVQLLDPDGSGGSGQQIALGDKLRWRVSHCDPTVNLYDHVWVLAGGKVEEIWPIAARGRSQ